MISRGAGAALLTACLLAAFASGAAEKIVTPRAGESLEQLAERLYGDPKRAIVLRAHNRLPPGPPEPGAALEAPFSEVVRVEPGATWDALALEHWGDARHARALARVASGEPDAPLVAGKSIPVPVLVEERLRSGETLAALSRRYYGTSTRAELLMSVNGIRDARKLRVGAKIRVPVVLLEAEVAAAEGEAPVVARPAAVAAAPAPRGGEFEEPLRDAIDAYLEGRYERALEELEGLRARVLARGHLGERELLLTHLVYLYVAFDRPDRACKAFGELRALDPSVSFDEDLVSPKIRKLVDRCSS
jgi:hypothetical protein